MEKPGTNCLDCIYMHACVEGKSYSFVVVGLCSHRDPYLTCTDFLSIAGTEDNSCCGVVG